MEERKQFCTFFLGDLYFGIDVLKVQEIILYQEMSRVPLAPTVIRGLINLRGEIVTAMDLRQRLGLPPRDEDQQPMNVVVRTSEGVVSFLVDDIGDVVEVEEEAFEMPPDNITGTIRDLVLGVYKLERSLLLVLDTAKAMDIKVAA